MDRPLSRDIEVQRNGRGVQDFVDRMWALNGQAVYVGDVRAQVLDCRLRQALV